MKKSLICVLAISILASCKEKKERTGDQPDPAAGQAYFMVKQSTIDSINISLNGKSFNTPEEIVQFIYPEEDQKEGKYSYTISNEGGTSGENILTLITEGIPDDSMYALKVVMTVKSENGIWKVLSIKEAYKCWPGRGHEDWGAAPCS